MKVLAHLYLETKRTSMSTKKSKATTTTTKSYYRRTTTTSENTTSPRPFKTTTRKVPLQVKTKKTTTKKNSTKTKNSSIKSPPEKQTKTRNKANVGEKKLNKTAYR